MSFSQNWHCALLAILYVAIYTILAILRKAADVFALSYERFPLQKIFRVATMAVDQAPMAGLLFLTVQHRMLLETRTQQLPDSSDILMRVVATCILLNCLLVVIIPLFTGEVMGREPKTGDIPLDDCGPFQNQVLAIAFAFLKFFIYICKYGGVLALLSQMIIMTTPSRTEDSLWCLMVVVAVWWFLLCLMQLTRTWTQFFGYQFRKFECACMTATAALNLVPIVCVSFLVDHELGEPCGYGAFPIMCGLCGQLFLSIIVPLILQGDVKCGKFEGDMEYEVENRSLGTVLTILRYFITFSIYLGMVMLSISLISKASSENLPEPAPYLQRPAASVAWCVVQFFFIYFWIWAAVTIKEFSGFEWHLLTQTMENCKGVVAYIPMLGIMFLCLGQQPGPCSVLGLSTIALRLQFFMILFTSFGTICPAEVDEDGNIIWEPDNKILYYFTAGCRWAGFIFLYGGFISGIVALCMMRLQTPIEGPLVPPPLPKSTTPPPHVSKAQVEGFVARFEQPETLMPFYALFICALIKCSVQYAAFGFGKTDVVVKATTGKYRIHLVQLKHPSGEVRKIARIINDEKMIATPTNSSLVYSLKQEGYETQGEVVEYQGSQVVVKWPKSQDVVLAKEAVERAMQAEAGQEQWMLQLITVERQIRNTDLKRVMEEWMSTSGCNLAENPRAGELASQHTKLPDLLDKLSALNTWDSFGPKAAVEKAMKAEAEEPQWIIELLIQLNDFLNGLFHEPDLKSVIKEWVDTCGFHLAQYSAAEKLAVQHQKLPDLLTKLSALDTGNEPKQETVDTKDVQISGEVHQQTDSIKVDCESRTINGSLNLRKSEMKKKLPELKLVFSRILEVVNEDTLAVQGAYSSLVQVSPEEGGANSPLVEEEEPDDGPSCLERTAVYMQFLAKFGIQMFFLYSAARTFIKDIQEFRKLPEGSDWDTRTMCFVTVFVSSANWSAACAALGLIQAKRLKGTLSQGGFGLLNVIQALYICSLVFIYFVPIAGLACWFNARVKFSGAFWPHLGAQLLFGVGTYFIILFLAGVVSKARKWAGKPIDENDVNVLRQYFQVAAVTFVVTSVNLITAVRTVRGEEYQEALRLTLTERTAREYIATQLADPSVQSALTIIWIVL